MTDRVSDLVGHTYGQLQVIRRVADTFTKGYKHPMWECMCACGNTVIRSSGNLRRKDRKIKSCGCMRSVIHTVHGMYAHPLYDTWKNMKSRCYTKSNTSYMRYGGRGIRVCARWQQVENFIEDMATTHKTGLTLDRKDNTKNYCKNNCRWATSEEQANNRRTNILIDTPAGRMTIAQASRKYKIHKATLTARVHRGASGSDLLRQTKHDKPINKTLTKKPVTR